MTTTNEINVRELLDHRPVGAYQKLVVFLCFLIVVMDGFDVAIMGFVAPSLKEDWQLSNNALAPVLSAALAGLAVGAMITGPLADKFGRRKVLIANVFTFGLFTLLVASANSLNHMIVYRFIAGCAMGGIMPSVATLAAEFSPARSRAFLVTVVFAGFTVGAAGGGFLAAALIPHYGWHSVFWVGGIAPIVLSILLVWVLPESIGFLAHKKHKPERIRKLVERCAPGSTDEHSTFVLPLPAEAAAGEASVKTVLNPHYRFGSIMLWSGYFMHLFLVYLLGSWMPTMIKESGMTASQASIISAMFQLGGPLGSVMLGWLMDRFEPHRVLGLSYLTGAVVLVAVSNAGQQYILLCVLAFVVGAAFNGGGTGMNALSSMFFPLSARATGNGWMHGLGRIGAILSAFVGAWMLNLGWGFATVAAALTVPAAAVAVLLGLKHAYYRRKEAA
ncbi:MFS transporter [Neisseria sp.]|uniref:MFS transporter n=1 Tax=Neisseria sp. TaxID=192066 RepID=UPI0026DC2571|nr:MFS transporter [Neisseria sp.]MDO4907086.1 MFS transporter [Neisseria sp.]